jgi:hypothetical protein
LAADLTDGQLTGLAPVGEKLLLPGMPVSGLPRQTTVATDAAIDEQV